MSPVSPDTNKCVMEHMENGDSPSDQEKVGQEEYESPEWKETEKRIVRKLDMTLLPMVWIMYLFNYLDRNNIAYAINPSHPSRLYKMKKGKKGLIRL